MTSRRFDIDTLMIVAAAGAAALGAWERGALLLFLLSLGHALEHMAMDRARKAIEALAELAPKTAIVQRDGVASARPQQANGCFQSIGKSHPTGGQPKAGD